RESSGPGPDWLVRVGDADNARLLSEATCERLERLPPAFLGRRRVLRLERHIDASGKILAASELCAAVHLARRLTHALEGDRDADRREGHLDDHRACPEPAKAQRG